MFMRQPVHCRPRAYEWLFDHLAVLETSEGLLHAAVSIAMHELPETSPEAVQTRLTSLAERVRCRVASGNPEALLAHLHDVLFDEEGFTGNTDDYYHPGNSYLPVVLDTRRGLPITLALVYKIVAEGVGMQVQGVNAPGHFMVRLLVPGQRQPVLVDPFDAGRLLTDAEAADRVAHALGVHRPLDLRPEQVLPPATHRQWISRMIHNLVGVFERSREPDKLAAMIEMASLVQLGG